MTPCTIVIVSICLASFMTSLILAKKNGRKTAQLQRLKDELKRQAKEQSHAQQVTQYVCNLSDDAARRRLHNLANKHVKHMQ